MDFNFGSENEDILRAIQGSGTATPATTLNTNVAGSNMPVQQNPLASNPVYNQTVQGLFPGSQQQQPGMPQNNFSGVQQMSSRQHTPHIGSSGMSSAMGLDTNAIMRSLGLST